MKADLLHQTAKVSHKNRDSHEGERHQYTEYKFQRSLPALVLSRMYTFTCKTAVLIYYKFLGGYAI